MLKSLVSNNIKLIVGLGNPGPQYQNHRHNIGARFVQLLADDAGAKFKADTKLQAQVTKANFGGQSVLLAIPNSYMNDSGRPVSLLRKFYKFDPQAILVAHDELDIPVGDVRLKLNGGHGGHNGLRDIEKALGARNYARLRFGVGHPGSKDDVSDYVLRNAPKSEQALLDDAMYDASRYIADICQGQFEQVMLRLHSKD